MNKLFLALLVISSTSAFAGQDKGVIKALEKTLAGKALTCEAADHHQVKNPAYRGDEGYFTVSLSSGAIKISDNGDSGYGFASGEVRSSAYVSNILYLSVGDDGEQTLQFDFFNIGTDSDLPDNCGKGYLVSQPDVNEYSGDVIECCLK